MRPLHERIRELREKTFTPEGASIVDTRAALREAADELERLTAPECSPECSWRKEAEAKLIEYGQFVAAVHEERTAPGDADVEALCEKLDSISMPIMSCLMHDAANMLRALSRRVAELERLLKWWKKQAQKVDEVANGHALAVSELRKQVTELERKVEHWRDKARKRIAE